MMHPVADGFSSAESAKPRWSFRHALLALATARAAAGSASSVQEQASHPSLFVFLLFIAAWCLGEAIPSEDVQRS